MTKISPLFSPTSTPTKEDVEDYLGKGRYRRFETIYDELVEMGLSGHFVWNTVDKNWSLRFKYGKTYIFDIHWGVDYFSANLILDIDTYTSIIRHKEITPDAIVLLRKYSPNPTKRIVRIEANLETMRDQEGFFELLPVLIKILV